MSRDIDRCMHCGGEIEAPHPLTTCSPECTKRLVHDLELTAGILADRDRKSNGGPKRG